MRPRPDDIRRCILFVVFILLCCHLSPASPAWASNAAPLLQVSFINVDQGDAILLRSAEKTILIDGGDDRVNAGRDFILPRLRKEGISHIDTIVISHPHRDHYGGLLEVIPQISVGEVLYANDTNTDVEVGDYERSSERSSEALLYRKLRDLIFSCNIPYRRAHIGMKFDWGRGIKVELLHEADQKASPDDPLKYNANEDSLVFKVTAGKISYLLTGDAEAGTEAKLVKSFGSKLKCSLLKFGHHGSKTSSSQPFMEMARPEFGVISVGKNNSFGHPNLETLQKSVFYRTKVFRTDQDGTIDTWTDGVTLRIQSRKPALAFLKKPKVVSVTHSSVTLQWETNKPAISRVHLQQPLKAAVQRTDSQGTLHSLTLTDLTPDTTYTYTAVSQDDRELHQLIEFQGSFTTGTLAANAATAIATFKTDQKRVFLRREFKAVVKLTNSSDKVVADLTGRFYRDGINDQNLIGHLTLVDIPAQGSINVSYPMEFSEPGPVTLIFALFNGKKVIDTASLKINVQPKMVLIDCSHGNTEYFTGAFSSFKMDLYSSTGFVLQPITGRFSKTSFTNAFALVIANPETSYTAEEIKALQCFLTSGGALMMFGKSDFRNLGKPALLNQVLKGVGSTIRFNDDQVADPTDNAGTPWRAFLSRFPSPGIISGIDRLLLQNACSLINSKNTELLPSKHLHLLAVGDNDTYNSDQDGMNDAFIYADQCPGTPIPVIAAENLGTGRVACYGDRLFDNSFYSQSSMIPTREFNQQVMTWLGAAKSKTLASLLAYAEAVPDLPDREMAVIRADSIRAVFREEASVHASTNPDWLPELNSMCDEFSGSFVEELRRDVCEMHRFHQLHNN